MGAIGSITNQTISAFTNDNKGAVAESADQKNQPLQLSQDIYSSSPSAEKPAEITQKDLANLRSRTEKTDEAKAGKGLSIGAKSVAAAVAGFAAGYVAGEIHKNMEAAVAEETPLKEQSAAIPDSTPRALAKKDIVHKSYEQFEIDNEILGSYFISHLEYGMIDLNKNGWFDKHPEGHGFFSCNRVCATVDDEPRFDIPLKRLQDFYDRNRDSVAYAGYITCDDIGELGTHKEKHDNGEITLFGRKTLSEVVRDIHPDEKDVKWALQSIGGKLFVYTPAKSA